MGVITFFNNVTSIEATGIGERFYGFEKFLFTSPWGGVEINSQTLSADIATIVAGVNTVLAMINFTDCVTASKVALWISAFSSIYLV